MKSSNKYEDITKHKGSKKTLKYISPNPISKFLVSNFLSQINKLVSESDPSSIHEVGCGEGHIISKILKDKFSILGSDISQQCLDIASNTLSKKTNVSLINHDIHNLVPENHSADLVICCEVLEHLYYPEEAIKVLSSITKKNLILSVPREPIWRILNMLRLKHIQNLGNTPGHIQHWSKKNFIKFIEIYMDVEIVRSPLPWTILMCKPKKIL
jgi:2-polyprenyl-3-methyl-5-hydroxy-6-metoxy-1,4-benzoquinol methylase